MEALYKEYEGEHSLEAEYWAVCYDKSFLASALYGSKIVVVIC